MVLILWAREKGTGWRTGGGRCLSPSGVAVYPAADPVFLPPRRVWEVYRGSLRLPSQDKIVAIKTLKDTSLESSQVVELSIEDDIRPLFSSTLRILHLEAWSQRV